jgi:hypothetical protein
MDSKIRNLDEKAYREARALSGCILNARSRRANAAWRNSVPNRSLRATKH